MRVPPPSRTVWVQVRTGALGLALSMALPACVLSEEVSAQDDETSTEGGTDADAVPPIVSDATGTTSSGGTTMPTPEDADGSTTGSGPGRADATVTSGGDADTSGTGEPEDLPDTETSGTAGATVFGSDCCAPSAGVGCGDPEVEACVCDLDPYCCDSEWDHVCVDLMIDVGCMACDASTQLVPDSCCAPTGGPGCPDTAMSECVCAVDPFCCDVQWDETCVGLVDEYACGTCLPPSCCEAITEPGCAADLEIESCVCAADPFCCEQQWDNLCVSEVQTVGCGDCGWVSAGGGCCEANGTPGCDDPEIEACVCPGDAFCCQTSWDSLCVDNVETYGCGMCPGGAGTGDSGGFQGSDGSAESGGSEAGGSETGGAVTSYGTSGTG